MLGVPPPSLKLRKKSKKGLYKCVVTAGSKQVDSNIGLPGAGPEESKHDLVEQSIMYSSNMSNVQKLVRQSLVNESIKNHSKNVPSRISRHH